MDFFQNFILEISNSQNTSLYYAGVGVSLIIAMMFFRKLLFIMMLLTGAVVIYLVINHFTGFTIPIPGIENFKAESVIQDIQHKFDDISNKIGGSGTEEGADSEE